MAILLQPFPPSKIQGLRRQRRRHPSRMRHPHRFTLRAFSPATFWLPALLAAAIGAAGCGDDTPPPSTAPTPTAITETFDGSITINGAVTHPFGVQQTGTVVAALTALEPADAIIGLSIGTWNGVTCAIVLANDNATTGASVTGAATSTGNYCARVYDVGKLTQAVAYQITITHF